MSIEKLANRIATLWEDLEHEVSSSTIDIISELVENNRLLERQRQIDICREKHGRTN